MVFVYMVRCNFAEPAKEQAWNAWYSGPKIEQMLAKPYFRTCQRFRLASGTGRNYLALWTVQSPAAFETAEYTSDWGFSDWAPYITDWSSRSLRRRFRIGASFCGGARGLAPCGVVRRRGRGGRAGRARPHREIGTGHDVVAGRRPRSPHALDRLAAAVRSGSVSSVGPWSHGRNAGSALPAALSSIRAMTRGME